MKRIPSMLWFLLGVVVLAGCATVISEDLRKEVNEALTLKTVRPDVETYKGQIVLWGGVIVSAKNQKEGTLLEVLHKPAGRQGRPKETDHSEGRFLALYDGYLDVAIYGEGREVTIAGEIQGERVRPLGEIEYTYPLVGVKEIHLWPAREEDRYYPYPYWYEPWWYDPYWW